MSKTQNRSKTHHKERTGRWSPAQASLFEGLIERYGKNWKKIHQHMKGRTLSQIRSHAQKYFDKVGAKKVAEFQRKAKLLEALETLQQQKRLASDQKELPENEDVQEDFEAQQQQLLHQGLGKHKQGQTKTLSEAQKEMEGAYKQEEGVSEEKRNERSVGDGISSRELMYPRPWQVPHGLPPMNMVYVQPGEWGQGSTWPNPMQPLWMPGMQPFWQPPFM